MYHYQNSELAGDVSYFLSSVNASEANFCASYRTIAHVRDEALPIFSWCKLTTRLRAIRLFYKHTKSNYLCNLLRLSCRLKS